MSNRVSTALQRCTSLALLLGVCTSSHFASANPVAALDDPAAEALTEGLTIVVTARRIEEDQQTVPVSVVSVPESVLKDQGITTAQNLQEVVPGLFVTTPNARLSSFYIRGLGSFPFNEGLESSVALFMDGVYLGRPGMSIGDLIDIERIEVARGPQGTLFGKNATAGTISVFTKKPVFSPEADLDVTVGEKGTQQYRGSVSGPLSSTLAGRLTAYQTSRDGLITNQFDGEKVNDIFRQGVRGQLLWVPTPDFSVRMIGEAGRVDESCCAFPLLGEPRANIRASDEYVGYQRVSGNPSDRVADTDKPPQTEVNQQALSFEATWRVNRHELTSLSAFRYFDFKPVTDDNTSLDIVSGGTSVRHRQLSQELRVASNWGRTQTIAGLYLLNQTTEGEELGVLGRDAADWVFGGLIRQRAPFATKANTGLALSLLIPPSTLNGMRVETPFEQETTSIGTFGSINWQATDQLALSGGLRITQEWKDTEVSRSRSGGNPSASPLNLTNNLAPLLGLLGPQFAALTFNQLLDDSVGGPFERDLSISELSLSGQLGASYQWNPALNTYLTFNRGVKSGGVNLGVTGDTAAPEFKPEIAESVELGLKSLWWDERLLMNLAIYHTRIKDYQAVTFDESDTLIPNPRLNNLLNVGRVTLQGADLDFLARLPWQFSLRGGLSYNRAITNEFTNAPDENTRRNTRDLSGQPLSNAPRWQGNIALGKSWQWTGQMDLYASADYFFRSDFNATIERSPATEIDGYGIFGARLGLRDEQAGWDVSVWGRNLTDKDYISAVTALYGVGDYGAYAGEPRIIGGTLRLKFR